MAKVPNYLDSGLFRRSYHRLKRREVDYPATLNQVPAGSITRPADPHRAQRRPVDVKGDGPGARHQAVENGRAGLGEISFRAHARVGQLWKLLRHREPLLDDRAGQDDHSPEHAPVIVNRGDLAGFPADHHDLPVFPEENRVADVVVGVEADAFEVPIGFRRQAPGQAGGSRTLRSDGVFGEDLAHDLGEVHGSGF